jgi:LPS sulfotransferase NodH
MKFQRLPDNPHLRAILAQFGDVLVPAATIPVHRTLLLLCFTSRTGSTYLAELLEATGRLNLAGELLNEDTVKDDVRRHGHRRFADYLAAQFAWRMVEGRFALKVATPHLEILALAGVLDHCRASTRFVLLDRRDRLAQAISYEIAWQTGQWSSLTPIELSYDRLRYSRARIAQAMATLAEDQRRLEQFFAENALRPVRVVYEDLVADPAAAVRAIGADIGLADLQADPARVRVRPQSGPLNERWHQMFLAGRDG